MNYKIRVIRKEEYSRLDDFLYEAIFIPEGVERPKKSIINLPELQVYILNFGKQKDDHGLVLEIDGELVGAVWVRIMNDYGHVDDATPSLAISLYKDYRGLGMGTEMMKKMFFVLKENGYEKVSLSVDKTNYAGKMYQKLGFHIIGENKEDYIMMKFL